VKFALVAGEASGDLLGAALLEALRARFPQAEFVGVAGPRMRAAGCRAHFGIDELSVMGLAEVLPKIPRLLRLRRELRRLLLAQRPDCFIGIDAPDFNLSLEAALKRGGIPVVHVVSPTIWAWRRGRVKKIVRAANRLLCLFPFELDYYPQDLAEFKAVYIGHPLADELAQPVSCKSARERLALPAPGRVVAVLPGSRGAELKYLAGPFAAACAELAARDPALRFVVPLARPALRPAFERAIQTHAPHAHWHLLEGQACLAMSAADAVLLASGTATLECLLLERPMVVAYRLAPLTAAILRALRLIKIRRYSLPNLLCAQMVVPEFIQEQVTPAKLAAALRALLDDPAVRARQTAAFAQVRERLRCAAATRAAAVIAELVSP
jgi:lipid-A-disaccharide synthase